MRGRPTGGAIGSDREVGYGRSVESIGTIPGHALLLNGGHGGDRKSRGLDVNEARGKRGRAEKPATLLIGGGRVVTLVVAVFGRGTGVVGVPRIRALLVVSVRGGVCQAVHRTRAVAQRKCSSRRQGAGE